VQNFMVTTTYPAFPACVLLYSNDHPVELLTTYNGIMSTLVQLLFRHSSNCPSTASGAEHQAMVVRHHEMDNDRSSSHLGKVCNVCCSTQCRLR
jgi:hypothetical protein